MKRKKNIAKKRNKKINKGVAKHSYVIVLAIVLTLAVMLGSRPRKLSKYNLSNNPNSLNFSQYTCCDSGDGDACVANLNKQITFRGKQFALLKSHMYIFESDQHLAPTEGCADGTSKPLSQSCSNGDRVFINTTDTDPPTTKPSRDTCVNFSGDDFLQGGRNIVEDRDICLGILNDMLIYVCRIGPGLCDRIMTTVDEGVFDTYILVDEPIPDSIKNCQKPVVTQIPLTQSASGQQIIYPTYPDPGKRDLQLETFWIAQQDAAIATMEAKWLSPWCKPAIYLYPERETSINVQVAPSGPLTYSIPQYPKNGWQVTAFPDGVISSNFRSFDYLYYEAEIPDNLIVKPQEGFSIKRPELKMFLTALLPKLGLNQKESRQFIDYWDQVLPLSNYVLVKVLPIANINTLAPLKVSPAPDTIIRVSLYFEARDEQILIDPPQITPVKRGKFTIVEWGGMFKRDNKHTFTCLM